MEAASPIEGQSTFVMGVALKRNRHIWSRVGVFSRESLYLCVDHVRDRMRLVEWDPLVVAMNCKPSDLDLAGMQYRAFIVDMLPCAEARNQAVLIVVDNDDGFASAAPSVAPQPVREPASRI
jgi:hypothetical protein